MPVHVLEQEPNARGDLFTRLMVDLFHSLGYGACRVNVHKSGRELDILADHRIEPRSMVAECKAVSDTVGGATLNKFFGVLDAERRTTKREHSGYFVSLSGFTETARQQEIDAGNRFALIDGDEVIRHLVAGRIIVDVATAAHAAGKAAHSAGLSLSPDHDLIADASGWIWALYFGVGTTKTHICFVHADSTVLTQREAERLNTARVAAGFLELQVISAPEPVLSDSEVVSEYRQFVSAWYGDITLEGMPADEHVGARRMRLENLYVPQRLVPANAAVGSVPDGKADSELDDGIADARETEVAVGVVLSRVRALAVLGAPGAGKSTLIKRLAVAYSDPNRLRSVSDDLPDDPVLPIVIKCRELTVEPAATFVDVLRSVSARLEKPELVDPLTDAFLRRVRVGEVLLLIDGLDEIPSAGARQQFVNQLRVFMSVYPLARLLVTSREVGFRVVAGAVDSICTRFKVADLSDDDITALTVAWHREVVGVDAIGSGKQLAAEIISSDRVRRLARNPLLLTIILIVKRWVGEIPRRRSVLYDKAIEVLLMTWNVEGHQPIDFEEAVPQLAFVAFSMMERRVQSVSSAELGGLLHEARANMPEIFGYAKMSASDFVQRVEERSSLLSLSGHQVEDGVLRAQYEFKHLTFQEHLAALAVVRGWHPKTGATSPQAARVIGKYATDDLWREVVPLACALSGQSAGKIVDKLIAKTESKKYGVHYESRTLHDDAQAVVHSNLLQCLLDEVQIAPATAQSALRALICSWSGLTGDAIARLLVGRFGADLREVVAEGVRVDRLRRYSYAETLAWVELFDIRQDGGYRAASRMIADLRVPERVLYASAALMESAFWVASRRKGVLGAVPVVRLTRAQAQRAVTEIYRVILTHDEAAQFTLLWALAWLHKSTTAPTPRDEAQWRDVLLRLWMDAPYPHFARQAAWAMWSLTPVTRSRVRRKDEAVDEFLAQALVTNDDWGGRDHRRAALAVGVIRRAPWSDVEIARMVSEGREDPAWVSRILPLLGKSADRYRSGATATTERRPRRATSG